MAPILPLPFKVHLTGFGPFNDYDDNNANPSWLAVKPLTNETTKSPPANLINDSIHTRLNHISHNYRSIDITTEEVPVSYSTVLKIVPPLHGLPSSTNEIRTSTSTSTITSATTSASTAPTHYDLIVHVGVGMVGNVKLEGLGRKFSYNSFDADKKLASGELGRRGFVGTEWESSAEVLNTRIDREKVLNWCKERGVDSILKSEDAGLYLCEYIYYCSLACAQRTLHAKEVNITSTNEADRGKTLPTPVLFVHVPPVNMPYTINQLTQILRLIIWGVVNEGGLEEFSASEV